MDNSLYGISPEGELLWRFDTRDWVISSPAVGADGTIYFGSYNGSVYALSPGGDTLWKFKTDKYVSSSAQIAGNRLYIGSDDNSLYALNLDTSGLADSSWPRFRRDLANRATLDD
jgi:outer membrane protein assembly factor BamB